MEFLEENVSMLSASPLLYVHCLDFDSQTYISLSNLDCCRFLTVLAHVSFPNKLRERRLCLFFDTQKLKDLETKTSPAVIKVKSSCIHKVSKLLFALYKVVFSIGPFVSISPFLHVNIAVSKRVNAGHSIEEIDR